MHRDSIQMELSSSPLEAPPAVYYIYVGVVEEKENQLQKLVHYVTVEVTDYSPPPPLLSPSTLDERWWRLWCRSCQLNLKSRITFLEHKLHKVNETSKPKFFFLRGALLSSIPVKCITYLLKIIIPALKGAKSRKIMVGERWRLEI